MTIEEQIELFDRAEEIVDEAVADGVPFSEALTNSAVEQAKRELGYG